MIRHISFDSAEYKYLQREQREQRIYTLPSIKNAAAVYLMFANDKIVVNMGTMQKNIIEARRIAHQLIEKWDIENPNSLFRLQAVLRPITAQQARDLGNDNNTFDLQQLRSDYELIRQTCYEAIVNCDNPKIRMQAAHLLQSIGHIAL